MQRVWNVLTDPALVKQWQFGSELKTDWKPGSPIRFTTAWEGVIFEQWGEVLEVKPYELIRYSLFAPRPGREDIPSNYFIMKYILSRAEGGARLKIVQEDNRPGAVQEPAQGEENAMLALLKQIAETK